MVIGDGVFGKKISHNIVKMNARFIYVFILNLLQLNIKLHTKLKNNHSSNTIKNIDKHHVIFCISPFLNYKYSIPNPNSFVKQIINHLFSTTYKMETILK